MGRRTRWGWAYQAARLLTVSRKVLRHSAKSAGGLHGTFREVLEILHPSFPPLESRLAAFLSKAPCAVGWRDSPARQTRSEEHTSELQSRLHLVCRLLLEKKKKKRNTGASKYISS